MRIYAKGDKNITSECPSGAGWAYVQFINDANLEKYGAWCSTVSAGRGCFLKSEWQLIILSKDECDTNLPAPLPEIN